MLNPLHLVFTSRKINTPTKSSCDDITAFCTENAVDKVSLNSF